MAAHQSGNTLTLNQLQMPEGRPRVHLGHCDPDSSPSCPADLTRFPLLLLLGSQQSAAAAVCLVTPVEQQAGLVIRTAPSLPVRARHHLLPLKLLQPLNFCGWKDRQPPWSREEQPRNVSRPVASLQGLLQSPCSSSMLCLSNLPGALSRLTPALPPLRLPGPFTPMLASPTHCSPCEKRHQVAFLCLPVTLHGACHRHRLHRVRLCFSSGTHCPGHSPLCLRVQCQLSESFLPLCYLCCVVQWRASLCQLLCCGRPLRVTPARDR